MNALMNFINDDEGVTAIEYGLIAALIAVAIIVVLGLVGVNLNRIFTFINGKLNAVSTA